MFREFKEFAVKGNVLDMAVGIIMGAAFGKIVTWNGGTLTVETSYPEGSGEVVVTVADTGDGIPADNLPRIFEPFFTTKTEGRGGDAPGTGLGLSVAQEIVTQHGGSISVQSEEGVGTTFEVRLPVAGDNSTVGS